MHSHHTSFSALRARAFAKGFNAGQLDIVYRNSRIMACDGLPSTSEHARNYMAELLAMSVLCELIVSPQISKSVY